MNERELFSFVHITNGCTVHQCPIHVNDQEGKAWPGGAEEGEGRVLDESAEGGGGCLLSAPFEISARTIEADGAFLLAGGVVTIVLLVREGSRKCGG
jgi:hypothetical protein